jgi:hypothetical protein
MKHVSNSLTMSEFYPDWQMARGRFNHDWLKNRYLPTLESFRNILHGRVQRANTDQEFWEVDLPEWAVRGPEAETLIREFEESMSPRILFDEDPLCGLDEDTKNWMGHLVNLLWSARLSVTEVIENATKCLDNANEAYGKLISEKKASIGPVVNSMLVQRFETFRSACHALAAALERFPGSVRVV